MERDVDVVVIGGGLIGSVAAVMMQKRGLRTLVLESRPKGKEQKVVVGEAITEGSSVFLRHEIGFGPWLKENAFRKFGFCFLTLPRTGAPAETMEDCHELLLSLTPIEKIPGAFSQLIPTYHVERTGMNAHAAMLAMKEGADFRWGAAVERVDLGRRDHVVHFADAGGPKQVRCKFVIDGSGRRSFLGRQLGITHPVKELPTAAVWNRFTNVNDDKQLWSTFQGIDRRRHTIHFTGKGFWIWWIHQKGNMTSVGVSWDKDVHQPDVKTEDHGFWEMMNLHPPAARALAGARPLEPFQYYAHLPYQSEHWLSEMGYALIGDAAWFTDALYSIGIETSCRQLVALAPLVVDAVRNNHVCDKTVARLNREFELCQKTVQSLNTFKYKHGWERPHVVMQTALYELGEIAELYHMQDARKWTPEVLAKHYKLQWSCVHRKRRLEEFQERALADGERDLQEGTLLKKALLPGWAVYGFTYPLWKLPNARPYFFKLTRTWGYAERLAQRLKFFPDGLSWMATGPSLTTVVNRVQSLRGKDDAKLGGANV
jgi:flavin-dependent dehydrogenase